MHSLSTPRRFFGLFLADIKGLSLIRFTARSSLDGERVEKEVMTRSPSVWI